METQIVARGVTEIAETDSPIPQNSDGSVDYETYIARTIDWWPVRGGNKVGRCMRYDAAES